MAAGLGARRMRSAPRDILGLIVVKHDPPLTVAKFLFKIGKFTGEDVGVEVDLQVLRNSGTRKAIGQCKSFTIRCGNVQRLPNRHCPTGMLWQQTG